MGAFAQTMELLARRPISLVGKEDAASAADITPALTNTGAVVRDFMLQSIGHLPTSSRPVHGVKLSNPFHIYSNYVSARFGPWLRDDEC